MMPEQRNKKNDRKRHTKQPKNGTFSKVHDVLLSCVPITRRRIDSSAPGTTTARVTRPNVQFIDDPDDGATNPLGQTPGEHLKDATVIGVRSVVKLQA
jgi:hypothetical protein